MRFAYQAYAPLQSFEFVRICRPDKAFTPHPARTVHLSTLRFQTHLFMAGKVVKVVDCGGAIFMNSEKNLNLAKHIAYHKYRLHTITITA